MASRLGGICCKAYYDEVGDEGYLKAPIGTGPYTLDEVINGEKIVLRANDGYWRGEPAIKEVTIAIVPNVSTQMIGLENGDYDAVRNPPIDSCLHLKEGGDVTWDYADSTGRITLYLAVWGGRPGEDLNFRRAVQCGIDKDEVNEGANSGCATILDIDMCPIYAGYPSEGLQTVAYDREKALDYLAASSCSGESFEILCQSGTACETVAKIIQSQLIEPGHRGDGHGGGQLKLHPAAAGGRLRRRHPRAAQLHGGRRRGLDLLQHHPRLRLHEKLQVPPRG